MFLAYIDVRDVAMSLRQEINVIILCAQRKCNKFIFIFSSNLNKRRTDIEINVKMNFDRISFI